MSVDLCGGVSFLVLIVCLLYVDDGGGGRIAKLTRPVKFEETTPLTILFLWTGKLDPVLLLGGLCRAVMWWVSCCVAIAYWL